MSDYSARILADGAVAYWRLGESSGTNADDAGSNNLDGTYTGTYTQSVAGAIIGDSDTAMSLPGGTGNYVTVADNNLLDFSATMTFECWVKPNVTNANMGLITKTGANGPGLRISSGAKLVAIPSGGSAIVSSTASLSDTSHWYHCVMTMNGASTSTVLYLDGVDVTGTITSRTIANTAQALLLGATATNANSLNGAIDEVAVYPTVLSAQTVLDHYNLGRTLSLTDTVTPSESRSSEPNVGPTDTATVSESQAKDVSQAATDTATISESAPKDVTHPTTDTATVSDAVSSEPNLGKSDTATVSESTAKDVSQAASDTATVSESLAAEVDAVRSDTATVTDSVSSEPNIGQADSVTPSDTRVAEVQVGLTDSVTASDAFTDEEDLVLGDSVTTSDSSVSEAQKVLTDEATVSDAEAADVEVALEDTATVTDQQTAEGSGALGLSDTVTPSDEQTFDVRAVQDDTATVTDDLTPELTSAAGLTLSLSDSVVITDSTDLFVEGVQTKAGGGREFFEFPLTHRLEIEELLRVSDLIGTELEEGISDQRKRELLALV